MARRGDICSGFNSTMFRFYLRKKYKDIKSFAKRMGVSFQSVYAWQNGDKKPTIKHVLLMADIFKITPRQLLDKTHQHILQKWEDHLMDYLHAPPETVNEEGHKNREGSVEFGFTETSRKERRRELKLSEKGALALAEKLGIFDSTPPDDSIGEISKGLNETIFELMFGNPEGEPDSDESESE